MESVLKSALVISTVFTVSFITSCNNKSVLPVPVSTVNFSQLRATAKSINHTAWTFVNYKLNPINLKVLSAEATIEFSNLNDDQLQINGKSFINYYMGSLKIDESKGLIIGKSPMASTLMAGDEKLMELENEYSKKLENAKYFEVTGDTMVFYLGDKLDAKTETMTFKRMVNKSNWFLGKTYSNKSDNTPAELGGSPFIIFDKTKNTVSFKLGDIMENGIYYIENGNMVVSSSMTNTIIFKLKMNTNSTFTDQYGIIWSEL